MADEIRVHFLLPRRPIGGAYDSWRDVAELQRELGGVGVRPVEGLSRADLERLRPTGLTVEDLVQLAGGTPAASSPEPVPVEVSGPQEATRPAAIDNGRPPP